MTLPEAFIKDMKPYLPADELEAFCNALSDTEPTTCIRINTKKCQQVDALKSEQADALFAPSDTCTPIPWNAEEGRYLSERPQFTLDPLLHAGAYYVQEAASQFVTHALRFLLKEGQPVTMLDLCAAPGGKSTAALSVLPEGSLLVSNEIDHRRARILSENVTKWGMPHVIVTGNAPSDFTTLRNLFDVVLTDVPCSGEGMFRKDEGAVSDWSPNKVEGCVKLQREILQDIWPALKPGGILIYGTCTFNVHEDEEQLRFICDELGAEPIVIPVEESWNIHQPLVDTIPCYRFMPHSTRGEGLFMAVLRKKEDESVFDIPYVPSPKKAKKNEKGKKEVVKLPVDLVSRWVNGQGEVELAADGSLRFIPSALLSLHRIIAQQGLYLLQSGITLGTMKGKDVIPAHELAMSVMLNRDAFGSAEVDLNTALDYLRREAITLPADTPTGFVLICYHGLPLGFVKNMGNRCNNLYPQEWRIRFK